MYLVKRNLQYVDLCLNYFHRFFNLFVFSFYKVKSYIVDFFCPEAKLVIELDGGQHASQAAEDQKRTNWLEAHGYRVIRFWNNEIFDSMDGVLMSIEAALNRKS